jgi:hypothetical protein
LQCEMSGFGRGKKGAAQIAQLPHISREDFDQSAQKALAVRTSSGRANGALSRDQNSRRSWVKRGGASRRAGRTTARFRLQCERCRITDPSPALGKESQLIFASTDTPDSSRSSITWRQDRRLNLTPPASIAKSRDLFRPRRGHLRPQSIIVIRFHRQLPA